MEGITVTERGLAVIVGFFAALFVSAAAVVSFNFSSVSDAPLELPNDPVAIVSIR